MREGKPVVIRREDYTAPAYWIRSVDLTFDLDPVKTIVTSRMRIERSDTQKVLDGDLDEFIEASLKSGLEAGSKRSDAA